MTERPAAAEGIVAAERPVLRVVSGEATPEEIAAVVAAVAAATSDVDPSSAGTPSTGTPSTEDSGSASRAASLWSAPGYAHRNVRATFAPGPDSWRTSFWPR